jgi:hypothetical protein
LLHTLHQALSSLAIRMEEGELNENQAASCGLNAYLRVLSLLHFTLGRRMKNEIEESVFGQLLEQAPAIFEWTQPLSVNEHYLELLTKVFASREGKDCQGQLLGVPVRPAFVSALVANIKEGTPRLSLLSYSALISLFEQVPLSTEFLNNVLFDFLTVLFHKHGLYRKRSSPENQEVLFQGLQYLLKMLDFLFEHPSTVAETIAQSSYFSMLFELLEVEAPRNKELTFAVLRVSVEVMASHCLYPLSYFGPHCYVHLATVIKDDQDVHSQGRALRLLQLLLRVPADSPQQLQRAID